MSDNKDAIMALLNERIKKAEEQFLATPLVKRIKAHMSHTIMEHGSAEFCRCPEWLDVWEPLL